MKCPSCNYGRATKIGIFCYCIVCKTSHKKQGDTFKAINPLFNGKKYKKENPLISVVLTIKQARHIKHALEFTPCGMKCKSERCAQCRMVQRIIEKLEVEHEQTISSKV